MYNTGSAKLLSFRVSRSPGLYQSPADKNLADVYRETEKLYRGPDQDERLTQHLVLWGRLTSQDLPE